MDGKNYDAKLKTREAVHKFRHGGKHIREMLRQRCREQIREKRQELFDSRRLGLSDQEKNFNNSCAEILRKEFSDLSMLVRNHNNKHSWESNRDVSFPNDDLTDIEDETSREHQFILQQYEEMQQLDEEVINKLIAEIVKDEVICPLCQLAPIEESSSGLICPHCKMNLPSKLTIGALAMIIRQELRSHNNNCVEQASFALLPENDNTSLYLICDTCANFALII